MDLNGYIPVWDKLSESEKSRLQEASTFKKVKAGMLLHGGSADCVGLFVVKQGALRVYIISDDGKEMNLYRLFERDICLFSASCMLSSIQFDVYVETEEDSELWIIKPEVYESIMAKSAPLANYTNELMAARFSEVIWLVEKILWESMDRRLAGFLLEESSVQGSDAVTITHEKIATHVGTAREVVTRMLRYFVSVVLLRAEEETY